MKAYFIDYLEGFKYFDITFLLSYKNGHFLFV